MQSYHHLILILFSILAVSCDTGDGDLEAIEVTERSGSFELDELVSFDPTFGETPESVATDSDGNVYVSLALTGEIVKIDSIGGRSHLAWLPLGNPDDCLGPFPGIMGALAIDSNRDLYVPVNSCDLAAKGIYRVSQAGDVTLIGGMPPESLGNGIALRLGQAYVSDSGSPRIFRTPVDGSGAAEVWTTEPLLADANPFDPIPGANGLQFYGGKMWVTNASAHSLITIDLVAPFDGSGDLQPGSSQVVFGPEGSGAVWEQDVEIFPGCDDFAFDILGGIYCTTDPFQTVVHLSTITGHAEIIFDATDGLDGPSSAAFGRGANRKTLYISNAQFPFFPPTGNGPSVLTAKLPIGGYPFR